MYEAHELGESGRDPRSGVERGNGRRGKVSSIASSPTLQ